MKTIDIYPSTRTIVLVFYLLHFWFKGAVPFHIGWLIAAFVVDYILSIAIASAMTNIANKMKK